MFPEDHQPALMHAQEHREKYCGHGSKYVNAQRMNRAHHHQLTSLIQTMFSGPMSHIDRKKGEEDFSLKCN